MTPTLWVTLLAALFLLLGTLLSVAATLKSNRANLDVKWKELSACQLADMEKVRQSAREEDEKRRDDERNENLAEARRLREEVRAERDRLTAELERERAQQAAESKRLATESKKLAADAEFAGIERGEFRQEIALLQGQQRKDEAERANHSQVIEALRQQH